MSRNILIPVVLALIAIGVYLPTRNHDFVNYDDPDYVTQNAIVQRGLTSQGVAWAFKNVHGEKTYWHPLTWISHMLDVEMFGLKPGGHHLANVFWHALNVVLLFIVLLQLTSAPWRSAAVAALFALHPLQVDTVAWITERKNLLSTFFLFATVLAYLRHAAKPSIARHAAVFVLFALGLMVKPAIVTLPFLLLVLDFWPLGRWRKTAESPGESAPARFTTGSFKQLVIEKLPLFALAAASSILTIAAHEGLGMVQQGAKLSIIYRVENAIVSYARYLGKTLWPSDLSVFHPHPGAWPRWQVIACGLLLLVITDQVLRHRKTKPYLLTGWLWFLGMLVPTIGILQVGLQAIAERFMYVPVIGLFVMIVWLAADLLARLPQRVAVLSGAAAAALIACAAVTSLQLRHWRNSVTLMEQVIAVTKNEHYLPHHNLGVALTDKMELESALKHFDRALNIFTNAYTLSGIARVYELQGKTNEAIATYLEAGRLEPQWVKPRKRAVALLMETGRTNDADPIITDMLKVAPKDPDVHFQAGALLEPHNIHMAMAHHFEAMKLDRNHVLALNSMAWILSTHTNSEVRSGVDALGIARKACVLTGWKHPRPITTLAAANAEAGNFPEAIRLAQQALELTRASGGDTARLERMLKEFQAGRPHREP